MREALAAWKRFFTAEGQALSSHPYLLFQQAFNQPDASTVSRAAARRLASRPEPRPWIRWRNKPAGADPCLLNLRGHLDTVTSVTFSPDGRHVVSAGWEDVIRVWDAETGQLIAELADADARKRRELYGSNLGVLCCTYSPDGRRIASVHAEGRVRVWDTLAWTQLSEFEHPEPKAVVWLPSPGSLVVSSGNLQLEVVDSRTGEYIEAFLVPTRFSTTRRSRISGTCCVAPGAGVLFAACAEKAIGAWDLESRQLAFVLETGPLSAWACAPDGTWIAVGTEKGAIAIWNVAEKKAAITFDAHARGIEACAISPDGQQLVTGAGKELKLWDTRTFSEIAGLAEHSLFVQACAWSPRGDRIAAGAGLFQGGEMRVWTAAAHEWQRQRPRHSSAAGVATFSPDGRTLVSGTTWSNESGDRRTQTEIYVWDVETGQRTSALPIVDGPDLTACIWPRSRREFVTTSGRRGSGKTVEVWPIGSDRPRFTRQGSALAASPDGRLVAGGSPIEIWDLDTNARMAVLDGITGARFLAFSPDGRAIVGITGGGKAIRWSLERVGSTVAESPAPAPDLPEMSCGAMSANGSLLARAWRGGALDLLDAGTLDVIRPLAHADPRVLYGLHECAFSPDGRLLASVLSGARTEGQGDIGVLAVWTASDGRLVWRQTGSAVFSGCAWAGDGRVLLVASADGVIRTLIAETGREIARFLTRTVMVALSAAPAGPVVAAGDRDGHVHLLSLEALAYNPPTATS